MIGRNSARSSWHAQSRAEGAVAPRNRLLDLGDLGTVIDAHEASTADYDDPPALPLNRPRHRRGGWWHTSKAETHFLDLPDFQTAQDRAAYMVREMGRTALATIDGVTADDPLFEYRGEWVSLNELLAALSHDVIDEIADIARS